jgi:protein-tyrosine-phosphatase
MPNVLFVCTGNTCRSVIAEYLARHRLDPGRVNCESAGIRLVPSENAANAIETLRRNFQIDASGHKPRAIGEIDLSRFDVVVAIDDPGGNKVYVTLKNRVVPGTRLVKWKIADPWNGEDATQYDRCATETARNINELKRDTLNKPGKS